MHIVYLCDEYPPNKSGGIGIFIQVIARALVKKGHQVTVVGPGQNPGKRDDYGVTVVEFKPNNAKLIGWILTRLKWRKELKKVHDNTPIDVLETMDWHGYMYIIHNSIPRSVPRAVRLEGSTIFFNKKLGNKQSKVTAFLERHCLKRADVIIAITKYIYNEMSLIVPEIINKPYAVIYNPVDISSFNPELNSIEDKNTVLYAGTLTKKKGIFELAKAWNIIVAEKPDAVLKLAAKDTFSAEHGLNCSEVFFNLIKDEYKSRVNWLGSVNHDELPKIFANASICVFPSYMETQGIVAIEAMAMAKATIFTQLGPGPEIIEHNVSGILVNPYKPEEIANHIIVLLDNEQRRKELGLNALKRVKALFDLEPIVKINEEFYQQIIERTK